MKKFIVEFVGTLISTLVGCGVASITDGDIIASSLAFGLSFISLSYLITTISGCHINPAVTIANLMIKKIDFKESVIYIISQILGAIAGIAILGYLLNSYQAVDANTFGIDGQLALNAEMAMVIEIILSFIFILTSLGMMAKKEYSNISGIVIGISLTLVHMLGTPFTGTSVNPARSIAPAIFQKGPALEQLWIFIIAPLVGAVLASVFFEYILDSLKVKKSSKL